MRLALCLLAFLLSLSSHAAIVINEIFYHADEDIDDLQWIELHNTGDKPVSLAGWSLGKSTGYVFPQDATIPPGGFLLTAKDPALFKKHYNQSALGPWPKSLSHGSAKVELTDAAGKLLERVHFKDSAPWPVAADGYSASIERICPTSPSEDPSNWQASPLPTRAPKPSGTPGKINAAFAPALPPVIRAVTFTPEDPSPTQVIRVEATLAPGQAIKSLTVLYHLVTEGVPGPELPIGMTIDTSPRPPVEPGTVRYVGLIPAQRPTTIIRFRVAALSASGALTRYFPSETDLRPTLSAYAHNPFDTAKIPLAFIIHGKPAAPPRDPKVKSFSADANPAPAGSVRDPHPPRGSSAFIYVDEITHKSTLFDYVNIVQRDGERGFKIHLHKDALLKGQSAVNIIYEGVERYLLQEYFAYDVYRRAGNAASLSDFVRLWIDGRFVGYHLLIEQPNRGFLRRNHVDPDGDLYKIRWQGNGLVGQHEKRTNESTGHDKLIALCKQLERTKGPAAWKVIQDNFDVDQVATYFAVNMILSHWDGYFNNHFSYQLPPSKDGTPGKWQMYPWDQDKTWGFHDGTGPADVFFDMPLTFGSEQDQGGPGPWWRRGGFFSRPLLANAEFRKIFLLRVRELLKKVYTPEIYNPLLDAAALRLEEDVKLRAKLQGQNPAEGVKLLRTNIQNLKNHLIKRREFLLKQAEIVNLPPAAPPAK